MNLCHGEGAASQPHSDVNSVITSLFHYLELYMAVRVIPSSWAFTVGYLP